jgi:DNA topoisomerase-6 subunit B
VHDEREIEWEPEHGTRVEIEMEARYQKGLRSVDMYLKLTAIANPHVTVRYTDPGGEKFVYERGTKTLPRETVEIKPHPHGVELGRLIQMAKETSSRTLSGFLQEEFSRVGPKVALEICKGAKVSEKAHPARIAREEAAALHASIQKTKIMAPSTDCISPIGEELIQAGLKKEVEADFYTAVTRPPAVYRGNPFQIEVGLAYGGDLPAEELVDLWRFANRVPLQYQQSACAISRAALTTDWRSYGLQQSKGALPAAPMVLFVHMVSVWVPFTSESKEAVAAYPEIIRELRLGLQEVGRRLGGFLRHRRRLAEEDKKKSYIKSYIPHIGIALREILGLSKQDEAKVVEVLTETLERSRTL